MTAVMISVVAVVVSQGGVVSNAPPALVSPQPSTGAPFTSPSPWPAVPTSAPPRVSPAPVGSVPTGAPVPSPSPSWWSPPTASQVPAGGSLSPVPFGVSTAPSSWAPRSPSSFEPSVQNLTPIPTRTSFTSAPRPPTSIPMRASPVPVGTSPVPVGTSRPSRTPQTSAPMRASRVPVGASPLPSPSWWTPPTSFPSPSWGPRASPTPTVIAPHSVHVHHESSHTLLLWGCILLSVAVALCFVGGTILLCRRRKQTVSVMSPPNAEAFTVAKVVAKEQPEPIKGVVLESFDNIKEDEYHVEV